MTLGSIMKSQGEAIGRGAAVLSAVEIGLGSLLHALHVPLTGYFLSLNQVFLLARGVKRNPDVPVSAPFQISACASLLKSLAPAGKKLTPMLAISCQGLLFNLGTACLGRNPLGVITGGVLSSGWSFLQPLVLYYLLYGQTLIEVAKYFYRQLSAVVAFPPEALWGVALAAVLLKAVLAAILAGLAWWSPEASVNQYEEKLLALGKERRARSVAPTPRVLGARERITLALKDLFTPLFCVSLLLTAGFFAFAESSASPVIWACLRPIATGFLIFLVVRWIPTETMARALDWGPFRGFSGSLKVAVQRLREMA